MVDKAGRIPDATPLTLRSWSSEGPSVSREAAAETTAVDPEASSFERSSSSPTSALLGGDRSINGGVRTAILPEFLPDRPEAALATIQRHNLAGSVRSHALNQLAQRGKIRIGIIDNFDRSQTNHGHNVEQRLMAALPSYLRDKVEIVRFDTSRGRNQAIADAVQAGWQKDIVALSVSGGLEAINAGNLARDIGSNTIHSGNRDQAFRRSLDNLRSRPDHAEISQNMIGLSNISKVIPTVTPVWNDGNTTPAALGANTIVTSIEEIGEDTNRTELPGIVDFHAPKLFGNNHTSQSAPYFVGQMLGALISRDDVR